jgi:hypothetical protein
LRSLAEPGGLHPARTRHFNSNHAPQNHRALDPAQADRTNQAEAGPSRPHATTSSGAIQSLGCICPLSRTRRSRPRCPRRVLLPDCPAQEREVNINTSDLTTKGWLRLTKVQSDARYPRVGVVLRSTGSGTPLGYGRTKGTMSCDDICTGLYPGGDLMRYGSRCRRSSLPSDWWQFT